MTVTNTNDSGSPAAPQAWSEKLDEPVQSILRAHGIEYRAHDRVTAHFHSVPLSAGFNKPRTNLLLRLVHPTAAYAGSRAFVDSDLVYVAGDPRIKAAMAGVLCEQNWKLLSTPRLSRTLARALAEVLDLLRSPLSKPVCEALGVVPHAAGGVEQPPLPPLLASLASQIPAEEANSAAETCFRGEQATDVAVTFTRPVEPFCSLIFAADHGMGCDHLALAAAHQLMQAGIVFRVIRLSGAAIVAGFWTQTEAEGNLRKVLAEAAVVARRHATLLILQDLDFLVKGPVGRALLSRAMDDGLRFIGVLREAAALEELKEDAGLLRRFQLVEVAPPEDVDVTTSLAHLARRSGIPVAPAALCAAVNLARKDSAAGPAGALALLGAAIAEAAWHGRPEVLPDDVFSAHQKQVRREEKRF